MFCMNWFSATILESHTLTHSSLSVTYLKSFLHAPNLSWMMDNTFQIAWSTLNSTEVQFYNINSCVIPAVCLTQHSPACCLRNRPSGHCCFLRPTPCGHLFALQTREGLLSRQPSLRTACKLVQSSPVCTCDDVIMHTNDLEGPQCNTFTADRSVARQLAFRLQPVHTACVHTPQTEFASFLLYVLLDQSATTVTGDKVEVNGMCNYCWSAGTFLPSLHKTCHTM